MNKPVAIFIKIIFNFIILLFKSEVVYLVYSGLLYCFPKQFYNIPNNITFNQIFLVLMLLNIPATL